MTKLMRVCIEHGLELIFRIPRSVACFGKDLCLLPSCLNPKSESFSPPSASPSAVHPLPTPAHFQLPNIPPSLPNLSPSPQPLTWRQSTITFTWIPQQPLRLSLFCMSCSLLPSQFLLSAAKALFLIYRCKHSTFLPKTIQRNPITLKKN